MASTKQKDRNPQLTSRAALTTPPGAFFTMGNSVNGVRL
jgi:hypothetical protein